jgi:hypothetical protein
VSAVEDALERDEGGEGREERGGRREEGGEGREGGGRREEGGVQELLPEGVEMVTEVNEAGRAMAR